MSRGTLGGAPPTLQRDDCVSGGPDTSAAAAIAVAVVALDARPCWGSHGSHAYGVTVAQLAAHELAADPVDTALCMHGPVVLLQVLGASHAPWHDAIESSDWGAGSIADSTVADMEVVCGAQLRAQVELLLSIEGIRLQEAEP